MTDSGIQTTGSFDLIPGPDGMEMVLRRHKDGGGTIYILDKAAAEELRTKLRELGLSPARIALTETLRGLEGYYKIGVDFMPSLFRALLQKEAEDKLPSNVRAGIKINPPGSGKPVMEMTLDLSPESQDFVKQSLLSLLQLLDHQAQQNQWTPEQVEQVKASLRSAAELAGKTAGAVHEAISRINESPLGKFVQIKAFGMGEERRQDEESPEQTKQGHSNYFLWGTLGFLGLSGIAHLADRRASHRVHRRQKYDEVVEEPDWWERFKHKVSNVVDGVKRYGAKVCKYVFLGAATVSGVFAIGHELNERGIEAKDPERQRTIDINLSSHTRMENIREQIGSALDYVREKGSGLLRSIKDALRGQRREQDVVVIQSVKVEPEGRER